MSTARLLFCTLLLAAFSFTIACGSSSNQIRTCEACPEEQLLYSTTTSGQVLTFPAPLGGQLGTPTSTPGPANSTGILVEGSNVYVSDPGNSAIRVYSANNQNAVLTPASIGPFAVGAPPGAMAFSGQTLYVASSAGDIFGFTMNSDGSLTSLGSPFSAGVGVSHLAVANLTNANFLYAANSEDPNGSISAFTFNSDGSLKPVAGSPFPTVANGGPEGFYVGENTLYVALKNAGGVAGFNINADGSLSPMASSPFLAGKGTSSLNSEDGFLFAINSVDGTISSYSIDPVTGLLTETNGSPFAATPASGDALFVEGTLFLPDASSNTISAFSPDLSSGLVSQESGSPFPAGSGPLALAYSASPVLDPP